MFRVLWRSQTQLDALELWAMAETPLQSRISAAINELERRLALDPMNEGEGRPENIRVTVERPLGIEFTVDSVDMVVHVERVWIVKERL